MVEKYHLGEDARGIQRAYFRRQCANRLISKPDSRRPIAGFRNLENRRPEECQRTRGVCVCVCVCVHL